MRLLGSAPCSLDQRLVVGGHHLQDALLGDADVEVDPAAVRKIGVQLPDVIAPAGVGQPDRALHHLAKELEIGSVEPVALLGEVGLEGGGAVELVNDCAFGTGHKHRLADRPPAVVDADAHRARRVDPDGQDPVGKDSAVAECVSVVPGQVVGGRASDERNHRGRDLVGAARDLALVGSHTAGQQEQNRVGIAVARAVTRLLSGTAGRAGDVVVVTREVTEAE